MTSQSNLQGNTVYVVDGSRTPFLKVKTELGEFTAADLAVQSGLALLARQPIMPSQIDEVIIGSAMPSADEANIGRVIALRLGCGHQVPAWTVQRNCGAGMQALDSAAQSIATGRAHLVLAGGTDAMSHAPLIFNQQMANWLAAWSSQPSLRKRLQLVTQFKLSYLVPIIGLLRGLTDPIVAMNMGQTAEQLAYLFNISRESMDQFAVRSHQRLSHAQDQQYLSEISPLISKHGTVYTVDNGVRRDSNVAKLATLQPFFDKKFGSVTAANSSQVTDGACLLLLASEVAIKKHKLAVLGRIVDVAWAALDPTQMGLGAIYAATALLKRQHFQLTDIDYWEINEAFAAQVLACIAAWQDPQFCQQQLGCTQALGLLDEEKLNVDGGAIALGHPIGASGARIVLHALQVLQRQQAHRAIATLCIGGGQGGAMLVERIVNQ